MNLLLAFRTTGDWRTTWAALAWGQARAAFAYFRASGYSWAPWTCRP